MKGRGDVQGTSPPQTNKVFSLFQCECKISSVGRHGGLCLHDEPGCHLWLIKRDCIVHFLDSLTLKNKNKSWLTE